MNEELEGMGGLDEAVEDDGAGGAAGGGAGADHFGDEEKVQKRQE